MKFLRRLFITLLPVIVIIQNPLKLHAVGASGLSSQLLGIKALGQANAFVAQADDPSANYFNPAGLTQLDGLQTTLGFTGVVFHTRASGYGFSETMKEKLSLLPHFYVTDLLSDRGGNKLALGFGITTPFGLTTEWSKASFAKYVTTKSSLQTIHYNPSIAYSMGEKVSMGLGLDYLSLNDITQEAQINQSTVGGADGSQKLKGDGGQWGYNAGLLWKPIDKHAFGASYRSQFKVHIKGKVNLAGLDPIVQGAFNFSSSDYSTDVESDLTFPQSVLLGYYYVPNERWTLLVDYEWTDWSVFKQTQLDLKESDPQRLSFLNQNNPTARNWKDVYAIAIGSQYNFKNGIKLRSGYSYFNTAVPENTWDPSVPDSHQHTIATGVGYSWGNLSLDLAYNFIYFEKRKITNSVGSTSGTTINGEYKTYVDVFGLGVTYKFLGKK